MDVLLPKLLVQTLAQRPQRELAGRERARDHPTPPATSRAREYQCPPLPLLVERVVLERFDDPARERERPVYVGIDDPSNVRGGDTEEGLADDPADVVHSDAQLAGGVRRGGPGVGENGGEEGGRGVVGVRADGERSGLGT